MERRGTLDGCENIESRGRTGHRATRDSRPEKRRFDDDTRHEHCARLAVAGETHKRASRKLPGIGAGSRNHRIGALLFPTAAAVPSWSVVDFRTALEIGAVELIPSRGIGGPERHLRGLANEEGWTTGRFSWTGDAFSGRV
jgi:hypothetical protein